VTNTFHIYSYSRIAAAFFSRRVGCSSLLLTVAGGQRWTATRVNSSTSYTQQHVHYLLLLYTPINSMASYIYARCCTITLSTATTSLQPTPSCVIYNSSSRSKRAINKKRERARAHLFWCAHLHFSQTLFERAEVSYFLRVFVKIIVVAYSVTAVPLHHWCSKAINYRQEKSLNSE